jgi:hypothetical protein
MPSTRQHDQPRVRDQLGPAARSVRRHREVAIALDHERRYPNRRRLLRVVPASRHRSHRLCDAPLEPRRRLVLVRAELRRHLTRGARVAQVHRKVGIVPPPAFGAGVRGVRCRRSRAGESRRGGIGARFPLGRRITRFRLLVRCHRSHHRDARHTRGIVRRVDRGHETEVREPDERRARDAEPRSHGLEVSQLVRDRQALGVGDPVGLSAAAWIVEHERRVLAEDRQLLRQQHSTRDDHGVTGLAEDRVVETRAVGGGDVA